MQERVAHHPVREMWQSEACGPRLPSAPPVLDLITPHLDHAGPRTAVTDADGGLSYAELRRLALDVASSLQALGVEPGEPVVVRTRLSRWAVPAMLGVLYAGAHYVPVDTAFPAGRQAAVIKASGARFAVTEPDAVSGSSDWNAGNVRTVIRVGTRHGPAVGALPDAPGPEAPAYCLYTSGSSGPPKGVLVSHAGLGYSTAARIAHYGEVPPVYLLCSSISFDTSVAGIYWTLATGGHLVIPSADPLDTEAAACAARAHRASHLATLPSLYDALLDTAEADALRSLRMVIVAGETCPPGLVRRHFAELPDAALFNEYGPTECTVWALAHRCVPADGQRDSVPIGRPIPGAEIGLVPEGPGGEVTGELWVRSPGVALGYAGDTGTETPFIGDGTQRTYRTGDLVRFDEQGNAHFAGRVDNQLKLAGMRIELSEIEYAVREHTGAAAAALGVVRGTAGPPRLTAFLVRPTAPVQPAELHTALRRHLPRAAIPRSVHVLDRLPTLPNGKLDRATLDRMAGERLGPARRSMR
ncbi:amino acid adenylation domain-containing protein [Streptomyces sp. DT24]|uniref:amino acid adenylation domain-containing protein n=1 Tax=Streptomyces sp. DT24 TaxID=3416520 RepID=UPI003CEBA5A9